MYHVDYTTALLSLHVNVLSPLSTRYCSLSFLYTLLFTLLSLYVTVHTPFSSNSTVYCCPQKRHYLYLLFNLLFLKRVDKEVYISLKLESIM